VDADRASPPPPWVARQRLKCWRVADPQQMTPPIWCRPEYRQRGLGGIDEKEEVAQVSRKKGAVGGMSRYGDGAGGGGGGCRERVRELRGKRSPPATGQEGGGTRNERGAARGYISDRAIVGVVLQRCGNDAYS